MANRSLAHTKMTIPERRAHIRLHHYQPGLRSVIRDEAKLSATLAAHLDGSTDGILRYADIGVGCVLSGSLVDRWGTTPDPTLSLPAPDWSNICKRRRR